MKARSREDLSSGRAAAAVGSAALAELAHDHAPIEAGAVAGVEPEARSQWQLFWRRFLRHRLAVVAGGTLILLYLAALFAHQIAPYTLNPNLGDPKVLLQARHGPSLHHWFGTDELGRDQFTRVLFAGRISLVVGLSVALVSTTFGTIVGGLAGYVGGLADNFLMRVTDLVLVVPALAILSIAGKASHGSVVTIVLILSVLFWMPIARVVRGVFLSLKEKEFVEAARASGASGFRIMLRHMLPNSIGPITVNATLVVGLAIIAESTLSFLGFGIQPPTVTWGNMLAQSEGSVGTPTAYLIYFPGLAILITVLAVNYLGDGLRDAFDPQSTR
ncbi:MAG: ABC transporter permease [Actinobacteria bacterium]|nr:MAG: ABC transporter permease [Actinomycetota bacterium]